MEPCTECGLKHTHQLGCKTGKMPTYTPLERLKHHVSGAIERGQKVAVAAVIKPKHTPGPWFAEGTAVFTKQGAYYVAETEIERKSFTKRGGEARANAALIAAAPEMLEALEKMLRLVEIEYEGTHFPDVASKIDDARKAIAKAKGE